MLNMHTIQIIKPSKNIHECYKEPTFVPQANDISVAAKTDITRVALNLDSDMMAVASGTRTACPAGYRGSIGSIDGFAVREIS